MNFTHLQIRQVTENDIAFLLDLRIKTMTEYLISANFPTDEETHMQRILYKFESSKIILWRDTEIGLLKVEYGDDEIEIIQLQILPNFQGRGLGKRLLESVIEESLFSQVPVFLNVLKTNPAQKLYSRVGFKIVEENEHSYTMIFSK